MKAMVKAVCVSKEKGVKKQNVGIAVLQDNFGIAGDAHAGSLRQVSLLAEESIEKMRDKGLAVNFGDFAENIVTSGVDLKNLPVAAKIKIGKNAILEVTQIGKVCVSRCAIYYKTGDCIMPKEGIFAKVLKSGIIKVGDRVETHGLASDSQSHRVKTHGLASDSQSHRVKTHGLASDSQSHRVEEVIKDV